MKGNVIKYERDNIDTDVIIPGTYLKIHDYNGTIENIIDKREHAPIALSTCGIKAVLAISFARIFYRNSVDGAFLLPIEIDEKTYQTISNNDELEINLEQNEIKNISKNETYSMKPFSEIISKIISAGGLFKYKK